jgi:hypothetical protein
MINLNDASINSEGGAPIFNGGDAGVRIPCVLAEIKQDEQSGGWDFTFQDATGATIRHREWVVDYERPDAADKEMKQAKRLKHILTKYLPEGAELPQAQNSEDLLQKCVQALGSSFAGKQVNLKVTFKDNGYLQVAPYVPFMELGTTPENESKLRFTNIDITTRPQADAPSTVATADVTTEAAGTSWP